MHVHKPKPVHGLREFLSEISVIVVGILIALAGEQLLEGFHWRHEAAETRASLAQELALDVRDMELRSAESACASARLDELTRFEESWRRGRPLKLAAPPQGPFLPSYQEAAWSQARASPVFTHIPLSARQAYSHIYLLIGFLDDQRQRELDDWDNLAGLDQARHLDDRDLMLLARALQRLRRYNGFYAYNRPTIEDLARKLHVVSTPVPIAKIPFINHVCAPLLAPA